MQMLSPTRYMYYTVVLVVQSFLQYVLGGRSCQAATDSVASLFVLSTSRDSLVYRCSSPRRSSSLQPAVDLQQQ